MIEFSGADLVLEKNVDDASLRRALASCLNVPEDRVAVIDDVGQYPEPSLADVVGVTSRVSGEFSRLVSIQSKTLELPYDRLLAPLQRLCEVLGTRCLAPDDGSDPYVMWLLAPGDHPKLVGVDPVSLDENRYVVA